MREVNAEQAEKELRSFLVLQLLEKRVGEVFKGVVTNISPRGIHVQLDKFLSDGFVKSEDLPGDVTRENLTPIWRVDPKSGALVDIRSGRSFNFGDLVSVKIANVDLAKRQLDLVVDDAERRAGGKVKAIAPKPGGLGGGFVGKGAGFGDGKSSRTGAQKRSLRSKGRDERKKEHRRDK
jgi:ribonuclease R